MNVDDHRLCLWGTCDGQCFRFVPILVARFPERFRRIVREAAHHCLAGRGFDFNRGCQINQPLNVARRELKELYLR